MYALSVLLGAVLVIGTLCSSQKQVHNKELLTRLENNTESSNENKFQFINTSSSENVSDEFQTSSSNDKPLPVKHIMKIGVKSKLTSEKRDSAQTNLKDDDIQFKENKRTLNPSPERQTVFFTQTQKQNLQFPTDFVNPNNRLQVTEEELASAIPSQALEEKQKSSSEENGVSFFSSSSNNESQKYSNEAVQTMNLTLSIVQSSVWGEENIVFSPLSISNVLALLMLGAKGKTFQEISNVLHMQDSYKLSNDEKNRRFHESFRKLLILLNTKSGKNVSIEIANQIFADKSFELSSSYLSEANEFYQTPVESFDFGRDGKLFKEKVNEWVRSKTNGKIKSIVDEPPSPMTTLAFVNAVYFKGNWEVPFIERITRKRQFFVKENETLDVQMMTNVLNVPYIENADYQMAGIPYKGNRTGFFVILPKLVNGTGGIEALTNLESKLTAKGITKNIMEMQLQKLAVKIPKMKISTDGHMRDILTNMGIASIFDPTQADFSRVSSTNGLYVSAVHHRAMVEINEKGTEAAAVTIGTGDRTIDDLPIPFIANRPFIFFIYHIKADTVLFWGRVTRP